MSRPWRIQYEGAFEDRWVKSSLLKDSGISVRSEGPVGF